MQKLTMDEVADFVGSAVYAKVKQLLGEHDVLLWDLLTKELLRRYVEENGVRWYVTEPEEGSTK